MDARNLGNLGVFSAQSAQAQKAQNLSDAAATPDPAARKKAAQEFASLLFLEVLKAMRAATPQEGFAEGNGLSRDIYTSMLDSEVARLMAKRDASGLTRVIEKALDKYSEQKNSAPSPFIPLEGAPKIDKAPLPTTVSPLEHLPLAAPVEGVVSSHFGLRKDPIDGFHRRHDGIDIAAPAGTPVAAAAGGKVVFSGSAGGYGNMVEILHHNGFVTRYAHNATNLVNVGEEVKAGQSIALVGSTGRSTGAHLHFEVRRDGKPVDPALLLGVLTKGSKLNSAV